jgi:hypothetical protein
MAHYSYWLKRYSKKSRRQVSLMVIAIFKNQIVWGEIVNRERSSRRNRVKLENTAPEHSLKIPKRGPTDLTVQSCCLSEDLGAAGCSVLVGFPGSGVSAFIGAAPLRSTKVSSVPRGTFLLAVHFPHVPVHCPSLVQGTEPFEVLQP